MNTVHLTGTLTQYRHYIVKLTKINRGRSSNLRKGVVEYGMLRVLINTNVWFTILIIIMIYDIPRGEGRAHVFPVNIVL